MSSQFLGYMRVHPSAGPFRSMEECAADRAKARQTFGLTAEQSRHPHLCFAEIHGLLGLFVPTDVMEVWLYAD